MSNAVVTVDACHPFGQSFCMSSFGSIRLQLRAPCVLLVTIAAFQRIGFLHALPNGMRQPRFLGRELFGRIDPASDLSPNLENRLKLADWHLADFARNVTVGTD